MKKTLVNICVFAGTCVMAAISGAQPSDGVYTIYDEETSWAIDRGNGKGFLDIASTEQAFSGKKSIRADLKFSQPSDGDVVLTSHEPISTSGYDFVEVAIWAGPQGIGAKRITPFINGTHVYEMYSPQCLLDAGRWEIISIPMEVIGNPPEIKSLTLGFFGGVVALAEPWPIYFDKIQMVADKASSGLFPKAAYPELIVNGDMEDGATGWDIHGWNCAWVNDPAFVHQGKGAIRIYNKYDYNGPQTPGGFFGMLGQDLFKEFDDCGSGLYEAQGWFKVPAGKGQVRLLFKYIAHDPLRETDKAIISKSGQKYVDITGSDWVQIKWQFEVRQDSGIGTQALFGISGSDGVNSNEIDEFYADDVSVRKISPIEPKVFAWALPPTDEAVAKPLLGTFLAGRDVSVVGKQGTAPGEFHYPHGLTIDAEGSLYVADTDNHRIQKCDASGKWSVIGAAGDQPGGFRLPRSVAVLKSGGLVVSDTANFRLQKQDLAGAWSVLDSRPFAGLYGQKLYQLHCTEEKKLKPMEFSTVTVDRDDKIIFCDTAYNRILKMDSADSYTDLGVAGDKASPIRMTWGRSPGKFNRPGGVYADAAGNIYVADAMNNRIVKKPQDGAWVVIGGDAKEGDIPGRFNTPRAVTADKDGWVYVCDSLNHRIQVMTPDGKWFAYGKKGAGVGEFNCPSGIAVDAKGTIYVADTRNHRIQVLRKK